jgi:hypothetical protein
MHLNINVSIIENIFAQTDALLSALLLTHLQGECTDGRSGDAVVRSGKDAVN